MDQDIAISSCQALQTKPLSPSNKLLAVGSLSMS